MDIVIISEFCDDFSTTDNDRFLYLAKLFSDKNRVEIITSSFHHTTKRHRNKPAVEWPFQITFIDEPGYPKNVCLKRFLSHYIWGKNVLKYMRQRNKPDVVYCAVPSLTGANCVSKYCERENIRFVIDVQDLWPEAFQMVLNVPLLSDLIFLPFKALANGIYKRADAICAVSKTYCRRAARVNNKVKKTTTVFLGTELSVFDRYARGNPILEKNTGEVWLAYCGSLENSDDLMDVIDALAKLTEYCIRFIIIGDGPRKNEYEEYAKNKKVNADFVGRVPYNTMCNLLSASDITVNPVAYAAAQGMLHKHDNNVTSGKPVVNTLDDDEFKGLIEQYHMGFNCRKRDTDDLAEKLKILVGDSKLREEMGVNARRCAEERLNRSLIPQIQEKQILTDTKGYCGLIKMPQEIWLGYAGTLGTSYDLPIVFDAMKKIRNPHLRFIVMGDGPLMEEFQEKAKGLNVTFVGRLDYSQMCGVLKACDLVVNPIVGKSVASIINKHADYAASGKPVLNTQKSKEYRVLIDRYQMGFNCESAEEMAQSIQLLLRDAHLREKMGRNARKCAEQKFDRATTYRMIEGLL